MTDLLLAAQNPLQVSQTTVGGITPGNGPATNDLVPSTALPTLSVAGGPPNHKSVASVASTTGRVGGAVVDGRLEVRSLLFLHWVFIFFDLPSPGA